MTQDIKFTSNGIPYILEFENVSVAPSKETLQHDQDQTLATTLRDPCLIAQSGISKSTSSTPSPSSSTTSFCHIESPPPAPRFPSLSLRSPSSLFRRKPCETSPEQCPSHHPIPSQSSNSSCPTRYGIPQRTKLLPQPPLPTPEVSDIHDIFIQFARRDRFPQLNRKDRLVHLQKTISTAVLDAGMNSSPGNTSLQGHSLNGGNVTQGSRGYRTTDALFCGTYGQMTDALEGAGLSATPCLEEGISRCTRLGALFVARNDGANGVQLRKITLWG